MFFPRSSCGLLWQTKPFTIQSHYGSFCEEKQEKKEVVKTKSFLLTKRFAVVIILKLCSSKPHMGV